MYWGQKHFGKKIGKTFFVQKTNRKFINFLMQKIDPVWELTLPLKTNWFALSSHNGLLDCFKIKPKSQIVIPTLGVLLCESNDQNFFIPFFQFRNSCVFPENGHHILHFSTYFFSILVLFIELCRLTFFETVCFLWFLIRSNRYGAYLWK